jgi:hypothetical protein
VIQDQLQQIVHETSSPKITRAKLPGGVAQAVESPLCKCKTVSSDCSSHKKKEKKKLNLSLQ